MTVNMFAFHRIIVGAAVVMTALMVVWSVREYQAAGSVSEAIVNILACLIILMLTAALVYANRNLTLLRHMLAGRKHKVRDGGNNGG